MTKFDDPLRGFYERRHPDYERLLLHWVFLESCYNGGRSWFGPNIHRYHKEGDVEFNQRVERAYRFNHTREAVDLVQKYLFKAKVTRSVDADPVLLDFWANATLAGLDMDQLMRTASVAASIGGRAAVVVDNNFKVPAGEGKVSIAEAKKQKSRIYAYLVTAKDILDYAWDEDGDGGLLWIKLREYFRDDIDPINSSGEIVQRCRLWTRTNWFLMEEREYIFGRSKEKRKRVEIVDSGPNTIGRVPVVLHDHTIGHRAFSVPGLIDDIAYLDKAVANYLSNLDAIIQDQTFSQLAIPAQALMPGEEAYNKVLELGTKRVFVYDGGSGAGAKPEYLSPDPKQAQMILNAINKIINEIYHTIGLAGERTKQDNAVGIDNSSGVAKAYDFERVNSLLLSKASACENTENAVAALVLQWAGKSVPENDLVKYPTTFDVMRLIDDLTTAETLGTLQAPTEVQREQMRNLVKKLFPQLSADRAKEIDDDIDTWLDGLNDHLPNVPPTAFGGDDKTGPSRQGQVTKDTGARKPAKKTKAAA